MVAAAAGREQYEREAQNYKLKFVPHLEQRSADGEVGVGGERGGMNERNA